MNDDRSIYDLAQTEEVRDLIHQAVAAVARGGQVGVLHPCGNLRIMASAVSHEPCTFDLSKTSPVDVSIPLPHAEALRDWIPATDRLSRRLARKCWPGRVRFAYPAGSDSGLFSRLPHWTRRLTQEQGHFSIDCPSIPTIREMIPLSPGPVIQFSMRLEGLDTSDHAEVQARLASYELEMILIDDAPNGSTIPAKLLIRGDRAELLEPGDIGEEQLRWLMGTRILFVCTGNTCRSPMAEALCKALLAERFGCPVDSLREKGFEVLSAGVSAGRNQPATPESIAALEDIGHILECHASRIVCDELLETVDLIYAMTQSHRDVLLMEFPEIADRVELLDPDDYDIPDPYGQSLSVYRMTADAIREALALRASMWTFLPEAPEEQPEA